MLNRIINYKGHSVEHKIPPVGGIVILERQRFWT